MAAAKQSGTPPTQPPAKPATKTGGGGGDDGSQIVPIARVDQEPDDQPILKRRIDLLRGELAESRLPEDYEFSFNPNTLVGSWFHRLENDVIVWQGAIIAEPRNGVYLVQIDKLDVGAENVQRLIPIERMVADEDGYDWRFFDTQDAARSAYAQWIATENARKN